MRLNAKRSTVRSLFIVPSFDAGTREGGQRSNFAHSLRLFLPLLPDPGQIVLITDRELKWALLPINNKGTFAGKWEGTAQEPEGKRAQFPNKYS